jgi:mono/diheme cytochrome c family protein
MNRLAIGLLTIIIAAMAGNAYAADQQKGKALFDLWCAGCHKTDEKVPGAQGQQVVYSATYILEDKYKGSQPAALEERTDLTPSVVKYFVRQGVAFMTPLGKIQIVSMMPFGSSASLINDDDLDALAAYLYRDPKGLEVAAADVEAGKVPSRIGRDLPHIFMLSEDSLKLAPQPAATERLTPVQAKGKALFEKGCVYCHAEGGFGTQTLAKRLQELNEQFESLPQQVKASAAPAKRVGVDQAELAKRDNLAPDYIRCVVRTGVRNMPQYPLLDISNAEVDLVSAYLTRNNPVEIAPVARGTDCQPLE